MKTKSFTVLLLIFICTIFSFSQPFGQETGERVKTYHVEHYKIDVKLDLLKKTVDGKVTMSIKSLVDRLNEIKVDAAGMNIKSVKEIVYNETDKPELAESFENVKYEYDGKEIKIKPSAGIAKNFPYKFLIEYSTTDPQKGMYFISPDSIFPDKQYQVWTQGEGEDNHYWFPCYDYPNDKATTETLITVDKQYITISNGVLLDVKDNQDGTKTWHWSLDKPYSSYLVMLAAGKFDVIEDKWDNGAKDATGIPVYTYVPVGEKDIAYKSFNKTADIIHFFSDYTGYKYPWHRLNHVVVEDFVYGGMENTGAIVYTDVSIYDDKTPPDYTATGLVAHENAHQWWGDVVTCQNWSEIWLNEGFATYFDALYKEHSMGKDEFDYQMYGNGQASLNTDSLHRVPIYSNHGETANTYSKGACVLDMLRYITGDTDFRHALNYYITNYQFQNVTTEEFNESIKKSFLNPLLDRGPKDFHWFFDQWIYRAGQPEYKASYIYNDSLMQILFTVQQVQLVDSTTSVFNMPVNVEIITPNDHFTETVYPDTSSRTYTFSVNSKPLCVDFNKGSKVLCKVYYTKPEVDWLYQLNNSDEAIDRIMAIKGLKDFINDSVVTTALLDKMKNDNFWAVRVEAAEMLANSINEEIPDLLIKQYKKEDDSRIRRAIMRGLANFYKNCSSCVNKNTMIDFITNLIKNESSKYAIAEGINTLSAIADKDKIYDLVIPYIETDSHNEIIKRSVLEALGKTDDERAVDYFLKYAVHGYLARLRGLALLGLEHHLNEQRVIDVLNFLISTHNPYTKYGAINLLKKAANPTSKPFLEAEMKKTYDEGIKKALQEAIDAIK